MPLDYERLKAWREPPLRQVYGSRDTILYALGLGLGANPADPEELRFVYEEGLEALPTMATVLASPFGWLYRTNARVTKSHCVHSEQAIRMHAPLPAAGEVVSELFVTDVVDKGVEKGALVGFRRELREQESERLLCTVDASIYCRADGGFGGPPDIRGKPAPMPQRAPDHVIDRATFPQQALLFRLNGDMNPLHADPAVARAAGFRQPILHGLCSYGIVGYALVKAGCGSDGARLASMEVRFSSPVYPGETLRVEIWREPDAVRFRARVAERGVIALDNGRAEIR